MTRARWILSAATLFVLWLVGALLLVPQMQRDLDAAAQSVLAGQAALEKRLGRMQLVFDGQQARLTGSVRTPQDRHLVETAVRDLVRVPTPLTGSLGLRLNPVSHVLNEIEVSPYPPGWLLLAATDTRARLLGAAANDYEARDLARGVQADWGAKGGSAEGTPDIDRDNHDEAASVSATLRGMPEPRQTAQAFLARIGQPWKELTLTQTDTELLNEARALGVSDADWQSHVLPALHQLRETFQQQRHARAERERLAGLPPGHLFIAVRDQEVVLRGEVGTPAMKHSILNEALAIFAPRRVHDEIRVSAQRRPTGDFGPVTTALLPMTPKTGGRSFFLGLSGDAWKPVDWQITAEEQSWKKELPAGLQASMLQDDSTALTGWLQGEGSYAPTEPPPTQPAFITLALFDSKAVLSGQVAEESVRARLVAAARRTYGPRILVTSDDLHVRGGCRPASRIPHTFQSLPKPPVTSSAGLFAIAKPGETWTVIPVTRELVEAGGLAKSSQIPNGIPAGLVEDLSAEAMEQLRMHLARLSPTAPSR
jgi:osmotically-inducible protein OsmY